jgi:RecJ-like exonuclease
MNQKKLVKISFIISIFSTFLILALSLYLEPKTSKISEIKSKSLDEWIRIQGRVLDIKKFRSNDSLQTLTLINIDDYTGSIIVVSRNNLDIKFGQQVEVLGKIIEYEDNLEIEASKIKIIK